MAGKMVASMVVMKAVLMVDLMVVMKAVVMVHLMVVSLDRQLVD